MVERQRKPTKSVLLSPYPSPLRGLLNDHAPEKTCAHVCLHKTPFPLPPYTPQVSAGTLKISLAVSDWPFCDPSTEPRRSSDDTPLTVCPVGTASSSTLETGAFLDVKIAVLGPSSSTPVLSTPALEDAERDGGVEYTMTGESAEATLVMSEWVSTEDTGWTKVGYDDMAYLLYVREMHVLICSARVFSVFVCWRNSCGRCALLG